MTKQPAEGNKFILQQALNGTIGPNTRGKASRTPLHTASHSHFLSDIDNLIAKGADVNALDDEGATPLHLAAACSEVNTLDALLAVGADLHAVDSLGRTPLDCAKIGKLPFNVAFLEMRSTRQRFRVAIAADPKLNELYEAYLQTFERFH